MGRLTSEQIARESNHRDAGAVTSLHLSHRALSDVSCLSNFHNLERIDLSCNCLSSLEDLSSCVNLKWLSVVENKLESLKGIKNLSRLTVLNAGKNKLRTMEDIRFATCLRALILNDNNISHICNLDEMKHLNTLVLSHNPIREISKPLMKAKAITKLSLSHCQIQDIGSSLSSCVDLKELRLSHNHITAIPSMLSQNIELQILDLGNNLLENWSDLKVLASLPKLKNLNLQGNPIAEKDNLSKKVKRLAPNLRILNAKPVEISSGSEIISQKDKFSRDNGDSSFHMTIENNSAKEVKRRSKLGAEVSVNEAGQSPREEGHAISVISKAEVRKEKRKRLKLCSNENANDIQIEKSTVDSINDNSRKERKKKSLDKVETELEGIDDPETSFVDLILADENIQVSDARQKQTVAVSDAKLFPEGLVVDHVKKSKRLAKGPLALELLSPASQVGLGGPSAWDD